MAAVEFSRLNDIYEKLNDLCQRVTRMETHIDQYFAGKKATREKISYCIAAGATAAAIISLFVR